MQSECFIRSDRKLSLIFCTIWIVEQSFKLFRAKVRDIFFLPNWKGEVWGEYCWELADDGSVYLGHFGIISNLGVYLEG